MMLTMARDLGSLGIRAVAIAPSLFSTGLTKGIPDEFAAALTKDAAFPKRLGRAEEYGKLAVAIVENPMLNGLCIRLDAGTALRAQVGTGARSPCDRSTCRSTSPRRPASASPRTSRSTVTVPDEVGPDPVVCFAKPGAGYARRLLHRGSARDRAGAGAQADWHAARGWIFVSVDHLGVGDSSQHDPERLSFSPVVAASQAAESDVRQKLAAGTLMDGLGRGRRDRGDDRHRPVDGRVASPIVQQGRYHGYDGIGVLGYSPLRTQPPTAPGTAPLSMPWVPARHRAVRRRHHQRAGAGRAERRRVRVRRRVGAWRGASTTTTWTPTWCGATSRTTPPGAATMPPWGSATVP